MKTFLSALFEFNPERFLGNFVLLLVGMLIIEGGRVGIQATLESEVQWIEVFSEFDVWIGWMLVWLALDGLLFAGKVTTFLISKTIVPIVRTIFGEGKLEAFAKRFGKKEEGVESVKCSVCGNVIELGSEEE